MKNHTSNKKAWRSPTRVFALVDCNNFFVSCERLFRPDLEGKPVVVLSSNDGCAVARSNEVKALGIPMAAPVFKYRELMKQHQVIQFSANFELYGNIANRITTILRELTPRIEVYSIDESFLDITTLDIPDYVAWGRALRSRIWRDVGIPVSVGIAPSKTLAKLASERGKKAPELHGVCDLTPLGEDYRQQLARTPIEAVWGVGWRLAPKLRAEGVASALALAELRPQRAQQLMGIHGRQMVAELSGTSYIPLEQIRKVRKSIMRGRMFGEDTADSHVIEAAIATMASQAAFRLRHEDLAARRLGLSIETNKHKPGFRRWYREVVLPAPTSDTGEIIQTIYELFVQVYNPRLRYHRINTFLNDFTPGSRLQTDLLGKADPHEHDRSRVRMQAMDTINQRFGKGYLHYAAEDLSRAWRPRKYLGSPRYVSAWDQLPEARTASISSRKAPSVIAR